MIDASLTLVAQIAGRCACSDATRVHIGPWEVPFGPMTGLFAIAALLFVPAWVMGWRARRRQERTAEAVLREVSSGQREEHA